MNDVNEIDLNKCSPSEADALIADLDQSYTESCCLLCERAKTASRYLIRDARAGVPGRVKKIQEEAERLMEIINAQNDTGR